MPGESTKKNKMKEKYFFFKKEQQILNTLEENPQMDFVHIYDDSGNTVLHHAADKNYIQALKKYLDLVSSKKYWEGIGHLLTEAAVKFRLKNWINQKNKDGMTPLHFASLKGNIEVASILQSKGARALQITQKGQTMLHLAVQGNSIHSFLFFRGKINLNTPDDNGASPLHWACYKSAISVTEYLLAQSQIDADLPDSDGNTPLHLAVMSNSKRIVSSLLEAGASVTVKCKLGKTPLDLAFQRDFDELVDIFNGQTSSNQVSSYKKIYRVPLACIWYTIVFAIICLNIFSAPSPRFSQIYYEISIGIEIFIALIPYILLGFICFGVGCWKPQQFQKLQVSSLIDLSSQRLNQFCFKCYNLKTVSIQHCSICRRCIKNTYKHSRLYNQCISQNNVNGVLTFLFFLIFQCLVQVAKDIFFIVQSQEIPLFVLGINCAFTIAFIFAFVSFCKILSFKMKIRRRSKTLKKTREPTTITDLTQTRNVPEKYLVSQSSIEENFL